ncbi:MAG: guanylate kinase [Lachnospiraceae bacterium]|nr:guanylate kinase [Lachnospiraceae bacterium]MBR4753665.1 guanylate kinase [Lachnospiraceae bacterium]MBR4808073.1 guanylate kinase [Lachnospiraceae bacterium]
MSSSGKLVVVSGFSGAGKGTVIKATLEKYPNYSLSISATTRKPREGEVNGREYFFKTIEEFEKMIADDMLVEYAQYVGNYYGTPKDYVFEQMAEGRDVILEIEIQGAMKMKEKFPESLLFFMTPPSGAELMDRLKGRGTEDEATIRSRMKRALEEAEGVGAYDFVLINETIETCAKELNDTVQKTKEKDYKGAPEKERLEGIDLINKIKAELEGLLKGE